MTKHVTIIHRPGWEPRDSTYRYYRCSCGRTGYLETNEAAALLSSELHVRVSEEEERLDRIRAAAPALLEALRDAQPVVEAYLNIIQTVLPRGPIIETTRVLAAVHAAIALAEKEEA